MNVKLPAAPEDPSERWWIRLHQALMPDYNRKAATYWWVVVTLGAAIFINTWQILLTLPAIGMVQVVAGIAIAMLAGFFPVRIPGSKISFAAGETFIFLLLLLHGPQAAALAAAGEGLIGSWRTSKRWTSRIASPGMACIAMFCVGSLLQVATDAMRAKGLYNAGLLLVATMLCAVLYFAFNTLLVTATVYLKRNQWPVWHEMFASLGGVGITFAGSASVACLMFLSAERAGNGVLLAAVPIVAMLLVTLHYVFRNQETDAAMRQARVDAAENEARLAEHHVFELQQSERRFHSAFTHASIGMALVSSEGHVVKANLALRSLLGLEDQTSIENTLFSELVDSADAGALNTLLLQLNTQQIQSFSIDLRMRHRLDVEVWAAVNASIFSETDSTSPVLILQVQDITSRRQAETGLHHIAFHDSLTGLPNRRRFGDELVLAFDRLKTDRPPHFCLMFLDVDRFKIINDSLGHAVGDELLIAVSRGIRSNLRPHDIVARLGGDEFAILAEDLDGERYAVSLAARLVDSLRMPFQIAGVDISTSVSIGITFSVMGYATPENMLRDADIAMYKAKAAGKSRYALFDSALHTEVSHRLRLEGDLRHALTDGKFSAAYQPLFELASGRIIGFEALARWNHPELGQINPETFIAVAEEASLITQITDFMLDHACRQLRAWQLRDPRFSGLSMNINISSNDIVQPGLVARVTEALTKADLQPQSLTLELTENILMKHLQAALPVLSELRRMGIGLSVDDFGTGYSSLRHLSALPVTNLKIDRGFIANLERGSEDAAVAHAIILLGRSLNKSVCAEGIETAAQMEQLHRMGCAMGQGFHLSRPLTAESVDRLLDQVVSQAVSQDGAATAMEIAPPLPLHHQTLTRVK